MKLVVLVGPTGSGKSDLALQLAREIGGEMINADSRQIYCELNIGTAKPSPEQVIPHHLYSCCSIADPWDAARYQAEADRVIQEIHSRGKIPLVVGGTGFYVRALLFGLFKGPSADEALRLKLKDRIQKEGLESLYKELSLLDPASSKIIHPHDAYRIIRCLEIHQLTGRPLSALKAEDPFRQRYDYLKIGLTVDRGMLYERINQRVNQMIDQGLEKEVRELFNQWGQNKILHRTIGYKEWIPYLNGEIAIEEVGEKIKQNTRNFAKRQLTWFRKEKDIQWADPIPNPDGLSGRLQSFLEFRDRDVRSER